MCNNIRNTITVFIFMLSATMLASNSYQLLKKANAYFVEKKYTEAIEIYTSINKKYDVIEAKVNLARCYYFMNNFSIAENQYKKIIEIPNINLEILKEYSIILDKRNKKAEAQVWLAKYNEELAKQKELKNSLVKKVETKNPIQTINQNNQEIKIEKPKKDTLVVKKNEVSKQKVETKNPIQTINQNNQATKIEKPKKDTLVVKKNEVSKQKEETKNPTQTIEQKSEKIDKVKKEKSDKDKSTIPDVVFKINLASFLKDPGMKYFEDVMAYGKVTSTKLDKFTVYFLGDFKTYEDAQKTFNKINKTFYEEAFIVAYHKGNEININEAINILTQP